MRELLQEQRQKSELPWEQKLKIIPSKKPSVMLTQKSTVMYGSVARYPNITQRGWCHHSSDAAWKRQLYDRVRVDSTTGKMPRKSQDSIRYNRRCRCLAKSLEQTRVNISMKKLPLMKRWLSRKNSPTHLHGCAKDISRWLHYHVRRLGNKWWEWKTKTLTASH